MSIFFSCENNMKTKKWQCWLLTVVCTYLGDHQLISRTFSRQLWELLNHRVHSCEQSQAVLFNQHCWVQTHCFGHGSTSELPFNLFTIKYLLQLWWKAILNNWFFYSPQILCLPTPAFTSCEWKSWVNCKHLRCKSKFKTFVGGRKQP